MLDNPLFELAGCASDSEINYAGWQSVFRTTSEQFGLLTVTDQFPTLHADTTLHRMHLLFVALATA